MITAGTDVYCVIGNPVAHSLSPVMHNAAFRETGIDGVYLAFEVHDIGNAVGSIRGLGIRGISVTIPHKVPVIPLLDELDPTAAEIGAVNTIVNRDGKLVGYNTDCIGAVKALEEKTTISGKRVLIIGAGGAARAVGFGLVRAGGRVGVCNRGEEKGRALADDLMASFVTSNDLPKQEWDIIINTTSVGMTPEIHQMPISEALFSAGCVVMDIVYNPVETQLLKTAQKNGCTTVDGVSMFVYQGASQFELWTEKKAPVSIMDKTVRDILSREEK
jgi:shikimate dehydrogenase